MAESAEEAGARAVAPTIAEIRRVTARILATDEDGNPRRTRLRLVEQIEDADERAEQGIF